MMKKAKYTGRLFGIWLAILLPGLAVAEGTNVFAAASMRGALDEIAQAFGEPVTISYAGSGVIARQVAQGAPADVVVLAHPLWMDWLVDGGHIAAGAVRPEVGNTLVVIAPAGQPDHDGDLLVLLQSVPVAMGHRDAVPAGIYAKSWLNHLGLWDQIAPNVIETDNVRLALALVAHDEISLGITYLSDALAEPAVRVVMTVDPQTHPDILYPAAAVTDRGKAFVDMLQSPAAQQIFIAHGFAALGGT